MPAKKRKSKKRAHQFTPEVFAAFEAGDEYSLRRALRLPPGMRLRSTLTSLGHRHTARKNC